MQPSHHPQASVLRLRAARLRQLAGELESAKVAAIDVATTELEIVDAVEPTRARLCRAMLDHNLQQLHQAADDLRDVAYRFSTGADELDLAHRQRVGSVA